MNQRDRIKIAEAKSAIQQICHILGNGQTQRILAEIDAAVSHAAD